MQNINKNWGPWSKCTQVSLNIVVKTRERHCDSKIETCNQKNSDMESVNCLPEGRKKGTVLSNAYIRVVIFFCHISVTFTFLISNAYPFD